MKAALIHQFGGPDELKYESVDTPEPKPGHILIKVLAAGINRLEDYIPEFVPSGKSIVTLFDVFDVEEGTGSEWFGQDTNEIHIAKMRKNRRCIMTRFEPGDTVRFTSKRDWVIGEVEEIRGGHEGDHLLVVRQGGPWSGDRYVVLSSYVDRIG